MRKTTIARSGRGVLATAAVAVVVVAGGASPAAADPATTTAAADPSGDIPCTALHVVGFQGTGDSGDSANPTADSGFLGASVTGPLLRQVNGENGSAVSRQLVAYAADFGQNKTYTESVTSGIALGIKAIATYANRCPKAMIAIIGYSQGAQIADEIARIIGSGETNAPIPANRVAGVSLFSSPIRTNEATTFPGAGTRMSPATAPGVSQTVLSDLMLAAANATAGAGISTAALAKATGYGALTGRVASWCATGDIACSTPADSQLAKIIANIAGQTHFSGQDPLRTVADIATSLGSSILKTAVETVNSDLSFSGGKFSVNTGNTSILGRLATNTNPVTSSASSTADIIRSIIKVGVMGFNAAVTFGQKVLSSSTITSLVTTGLTNPAAVLVDLGVQLGKAALELVPPATVLSGVQYIFNQITSLLSDNVGLVQMALDLRYWQSGAQHTSYDSWQVGSDGQTPTAFTVAWFGALATALDAKAKASSTSKPSTTTTRATTTTATTTPAPVTTTTVRPSTTSPVPTTAVPGQ
ncbi:cutinase family protein [Nocardia yamanashiensis]|uniref:cutinase family protein n=1 Tax=Nocardia yamanashiensis TaxID=209247 RepID=UPI00082A57E7|nr:cutinase family protein [Nocardia yamanashiensis]